MPQAHKFLRAQETLWCRFWVITHLQIFPGLLRTRSHVKRLPQPVGWGQQPSSQECPGEYSTSCVCGGREFGGMPHVCQAPCRNKNGSCPSSSHCKATQLSPSPHIPGPPKLPPLHQSPGECLQMSESACELCKMPSGFPATLHPTGIGRQSPGWFPLPDTVGTPLPSTGPLVWGWGFSLFRGNLCH